MIGVCNYEGEHFVCRKRTLIFCGLKKVKSRKQTSRFCCQQSHALGWAWNLHFNQPPGHFWATLEPKNHMLPCALLLHPDQNKNPDKNNDPASNSLQKTVVSSHSQDIWLLLLSLQLYSVKGQGPGLPGNSNSRKSAFLLDCSLTWAVRHLICQLERVGEP